MRFILFLLIFQTINFTSNFDVYNSGKKLSSAESVKFLFAQTHIEKRSIDNQDSNTEQTTLWAVLPSQVQGYQKGIFSSRYSNTIKDTRIFLFSLQPRSPPSKV